MADPKNGGNAKMVMIVLSALITLLLAMVGIVGTILINIGSNNSDAIAAQNKTIAIQTTHIALIQNDMAELQQDDKIDAGQQSQLSRQWDWLGTLHDEANRHRFKESMEALPRPRKDSP